MDNDLKKQILNHLNTYNITKLEYEEIGPDKFILRITFNGLIKKTK